MTTTRRRPAPLAWDRVELDLGAFRLADVSLALAEGEWVALMGPTGAGKTLLCETAVGFLAPTGGRVLARGHDLTGRPPEDRGIGYAPQDDLLFPHLTVRENLGFGMWRGVRAAEVAAAAEGLEIAHLLGRRTATLSGGEGQRVAVGRALLAGGEVWLLDECTSALDEDARERVGSFLKTWQARAGASVLQITHDPAEAERLADRVVHMSRGRLLAAATEAAAGARP
ncbi:MAG: ATP-binding cassette domain-containing protein [Candidatus Eisenbacteria bacterium]|nr:ATP-binding cassette domain-containing protein [Candidatus Eisenbacteria bacterium]